MRKDLELVHFDKILCEYRLKDGLTLSIDDSSRLADSLKNEGVEGYRVGSYDGKGYLTRYLEHFVECIPMLEYKNTLIPLIFRDSPATRDLFLESYRWPALLQLLDWHLKYEPETALVTPRVSYKKKIVDTAFLTFRLAEICDGAAFPLTNFRSLEEFEKWNEVHRLIDNGSIGRHAKIFNSRSFIDLEELEMIIKIVKLKYKTILPGS